MLAILSNKILLYVVFVSVVPFGVLMLVPESPIRTPFLLIGLGIPLILRLVPRNWIYGMRTCYALSSDERWYRQNLITGVAMVLGGAVWMLS